MPDPTGTCPKCGRAIPTTAPRQLCPACLVASLLESANRRPDHDRPEMPAPAAAAERVGHYELIETLGRGGMGVVFRARDLRLNRLVALKLILTGRLASDAEVKRFRTEAEAAAQLEHPHIVPIYEVGESDGRHFFAMKLVEGCTLAVWIEATWVEKRHRGNQELSGVDPAGATSSASAAVAPSQSPILESQFALATFVAKTARAVHHAHQRGILHRDLKPANILLDAAGEPMVTDFGLARRLGEDQQLTMSGTVLGSPCYMAPEQARGRAGEVTTAADIYSLGAILYELLAGRPPFVGETALDTLRLAMEQEPVPPSQRAMAHLANVHRKSKIENRVDRDLETICLKCLEKDPAHRYASAAELAEDLERWTRHEPILARPSGVLGRFWKWARRHPAAAALAVVSGLALVGVLVLQQFNERRLTEQRDIAQAQEKHARENERTTRLNLYAADMFLAARALDQGNLALAQRTLATHRPRSGAEDLRGFEWRHYWQRAQGQQERVLHGFSNAVNCVAFSPDGRWLAAGGGNLVQKWSLTDLTRIATFRHEPKAVVNSLAFSPDGASIWAGETRGQLRVWVDGLTRPVGEITRGTGWVHIAVPGGPTSTLAIGERSGPEGGARGSVALYGFLDLLQRNERGTPLPNSGGLAAFSRDGRWLLTGGGEDRLFRHNLKTGESLPVPGWAELLMTLALAPDGMRAATSPGNGTGLCLYDFRGNQPAVANVSLDWRCRALAFSPDGKMLAAASYDHTVRLLHPVHGYQTHRFDGHTDQVLAVAFAPDGQTLASAAKDGTVRLWDLTARQRDTVTGVFAPFALSVDGRIFWAANVDDWQATVLRRDLDSPDREPEPVLRLSAERFPDLSRKHNGLLRWLVQGSASPAQQAKLEEFVGRDTNRIIWRTAPAGATPSKDRVAARVKGVSASASDGSVLAMADRGKVRLWHTFTARRLPDPQPSPRDVRQMALSDDGRWLALSAGASNVVSLWDTATGSNCFRLPPRPGAVNDLVFSPKGSTLAIAGEDATVQLLDIPGGHVRATLTGHEVGLTTVAFAPDGRTLASLAGTWLKLWHLPTLREVGSLRTGGDHLAFSPDGTLLIGLAWNGTAWLLRAPEVDESASRRAPGW